MAAKEPVIVIAGLEVVIKRDLEKHKLLLIQSKADLDTFRLALSHQIKKKKYYVSQIGGGKYSDVALQKSIVMIGVDIRHMSDKVKLSEEALAHHSLIVDILTAQLADQYKNLKILTEFRERSSASNN
jgi:hypothetical protein